MRAAKIGSEHKQRQFLAPEMRLCAGSVCERGAWREKAVILSDGLWSSEAERRKGISWWWGRLGVLVTVKHII